MNRHASLWIGAALLAAGCQPSTSPDADPGASFELQTEEDRTYYALGAMMAGNLGSLTPQQRAALQAGVSDAVTSRPPKLDLMEYRPKVGELLNARATAKAAERRAQSEAFLAQAGQEPGAQRTDSGIVYTSLAEGDGPQPGAGDTVRVHYRGTLPDGTEFDSSYSRNQPAEFGLGGVIPCWSEGVRLMKVGARAKLVCPPELAYGDQGSPPAIPGGAALVFEVELLAIVAAAK